MTSLRILLEFSWIADVREGGRLGLSGKYINVKKKKGMQSPAAAKRILYQYKKIIKI